LSVSVAVAVALALAALAALAAVGRLQGSCNYLQKSTI